MANVLGDKIRDLRKEKKLTLDKLARSNCFDVIGGVSEIEVTLFDDASFQVARDRFTCNDGAGVVLDLPQQSYTILGRAIGMDGAEMVQFEGTVEVAVKRGSESNASLVLGASE